VFAPSTTFDLSPTGPEINVVGRKFNGAVFAGFDSRLARNYSIAGQTLQEISLWRNDPDIFTARTLRSQTGPGDTANQANSAAALNFINGAIYGTGPAWSSYSAPQYVNWQAGGSSIKYGFQVIGWALGPTPTATSTSAWGEERRARYDMPLHLLQHDHVTCASFLPILCPCRVCHVVLNGNLHVHLNDFADVIADIDLVQHP
jgi:hypothetical protein